jgi:aryl-alcohol dehydrogenase-like predicted oxidoreductase
VSTKTVEGGIRTLELMDAVMATYTADRRDEEPVLDYAAAHRKGVILKKVLSSGHAADVPAAIRFAFSHPGVASAVVGTINPTHLREIAAAVEAAVRVR